MIDKTNYNNIEIPDNLDAVVQEAIAAGLAERRKDRLRRPLKRAGFAAAMFAVCMISALNLSPTFAAAPCELPVVGVCVRFSCFGSIIRRTPSNISA